MFVFRLPKKHSWISHNIGQVAYFCQALTAHKPKAFPYMTALTDIKDSELQCILDALLVAAVQIHEEVKSGNGLDVTAVSNVSGDSQLTLDVLADSYFQDTLASNTQVRYIVSEERPNLVAYGNGDYSVSLDPLDGSKSAAVGIPPGAIFGVFKDAQDISDFNGQHIVMGGFFVFGINLEVYFSLHGAATTGVWDACTNSWTFRALPAMPTKKMIAINASNRTKWNPWLQDYFDGLINHEDENGNSFNLRWYASMVSEIKRLLLEGGIFSYPSDKRPGYVKGHLRLVYEAIPMAYVLAAVGGKSSNGDASILALQTTELHQKTPVFLGEAALITEMEKAKKGLGLGI